MTEPDAPWKLPPLILHPFSEPAGPEKLKESSRASLILQGLLPPEDFSLEDLERNLLEGRYCELSMLFYVGKDLMRWAAQCMEVAGRAEALRQAGLRRESFLQMIVADPPAAVDRKLRSWGVNEYRSIFTRAIGLQTAFQDLPPRQILAPGFVRHYHQFAEQIFACGQQLHSFTEIRSADFAFDLYASGEYTKMLEDEWGSPE